MIDIFEVIQTAPDAHLRNILRLLCESDYNSKQEVISLHGKITELQSRAGAHASNKRKRGEEAEVLYCACCEDCFIEEDNHDRACSYHPGERIPDRDGFFADHDEEIHGMLDDPEVMKNYPRGYVMSCCDKTADKEGCKVARHWNSKRQKQLEGSAPSFGDEGSDEEDEEEELDEESGEEEEDEDEDEDEGEDERA